MLPAKCGRRALATRPRRRCDAVEIEFICGRSEACLVDNSAHVTPGSPGDHVSKIQFALNDLDGLQIADAEIDAKLYGQTTADAVLAYKRKRNIINFSCQTTADNIVGKMTIKSLDDEMFDKQENLVPPLKLICTRTAATDGSPDKESVSRAGLLAALTPQQRAMLA
jgi:hypothetical protein